MIQKTALGRTGLQVSRLGVGLAEIGHLSDPDVAGEILNLALDGGINFLDTAACYGNSEEWIGRTVADRRDEYVLATKAGHVTGGYSGQPWTRQTILDSIDRSLKRMKTDRLDLVQLHSCDVPTLERGEVIQALEEARDAGKTRFIGYSGDDQAALWAIESGRFDTLQTSFNVVDQDAFKLFPKAKEKGMGIIIKRPIANAAWSEEARTSRRTYEQRAQAMEASGPIPDAPDDPILLSLGFTLAHDQVDTAIVGTANPEHMRENLKLVESLPIPESVVQELHRRYEKLTG